MRVWTWVALLGCALGARAQDLAGPVPVDQFHPDRQQAVSPRRGGTINVRTPGDPSSINPICDNGAPTQDVFQYLSDRLATRHRETYEWLPMLARWWKEQDTLELADGRTFSGRLLTKPSADPIRFAPDAARFTFAECDLQAVELVGADGEASRVDVGTPAFEGCWGQIVTVIPKPDSGLPRVRGTLERPPGGQYTVWLWQELPAADVLSVAHSEIKQVLEGPDGAKIEVPALRQLAAFEFHLRPGVTWHDGQPVTAADVIFSLETIMNPVVDAAHLRQFYADLDAWEQVDELTLTFRFKQQYYRAFSVIADALYIYPRHRYEPWKFEGDEDGFGRHFNAHPDHEKPIGCGPYRFVRWERGTLVELARYDGWWASNPGGEPVVPWIDPLLPYLDTIRWVVINEKTAAFKALNLGEVDADFDLEPGIWEGGESNAPSFTDRFVRAKVLSPLYTYIGWNANRKDKGPERQIFADGRVRQAMTLLIPRERILRDIHRGLGEVVTGPFFSKGPFSDPDVQVRPASLERAQMLLDQAGWVDHDGDGIRDRGGVDFEFDYVIHNMRDYHQKVAEIIKEAVERVGVRMNIRKLDWAVFLDTISDQKFDAVRLAWGEPAPIETDPFQIWHSSQAGNRGNNYVSFQSAEADALIMDARREVDPVERQRLLRKLHRLLDREQPYTFLLNMYTLGFYNRRFRNVRFYPNGTTSYDFREWFVAEDEGR